MSLPLRECGLKFLSFCFHLWLLVSLPLRECGLKFQILKVGLIHYTSLPLRECGLKSLISLPRQWSNCHSPCGSVDWNTNKQGEVFSSFVTPLAGVWIEIILSSYCLTARFRHSPCGSVDWNFCRWRKAVPIFVTPLAGVWIEICVFIYFWIGVRSLPLRECGLKWYQFRYIHSWQRVTPLAGVWIEIMGSPHFSQGVSVTPLAGVWIEICHINFLTSRHKSLPLRECGLKSHTGCG